MRTAEEIVDFYIAHPAPGRRFRLMPDERRTCRGIADEEPDVAIGAAVELPHPALMGLRTRRGLYPIRRDDAVSGLGQSGDNADQFLRSARGV